MESSERVCFEVDATQHGTRTAYLGGGDRMLAAAAAGAVVAMAGGQRAGRGEAGCVLFSSFSFLTHGRRKNGSCLQKPVFLGHLTK